MKKILKRVLVFILIFTISFSRFEVRKVQANPLIIAGIEITWEVIVFIGSLLAAAGITFADTADLENAVKSWAASRPEAFKQAMALKALQVGGVVSVGVSALKGFWDNVVGFFNPYYDISTGNIDANTPNSVISSGIYQGFNLVTRESMLSELGFKNPDMGSGTNGGDKNVIDKFSKEYSKRYSSLAGYNQGLFVTNGIGGYSYNLQIDMNNESCFMYLYKDGSLIKTIFSVSSCYSFTGLDAYLIYNYDSSGNIYIDVVHSYIYMSSDTRYSLGVRHTSGEKVVTAMDIDVPSFAGTVAGVNVLDDTTDYVGTIGAISDVAGVPLTDTDAVGIRVLDNPIGATREGVIVGVTDVPDVPVTDVGGILSWLNSFWDALKSLLNSFGLALVGTGVIELSGLKVNGNALLTVFPFCIPFDFVSSVKGLFINGKAPVYTMDFTGTMFGTYIWELDLSDYESIAKVVRWCVWIGFFVGLMMVTRRFIRW